MAWPILTLDDFRLQAIDRFRLSGLDRPIEIPAGPVNYTITQGNALAHDTTNGTYNSVCMIDDTHFILAHAGPNDDGYIKTFVINQDSSITQIDVLEHDILMGTYNSLVMIDTTHFILAYTGDGFDGYIKTFSIDANYDNITQIDVLEHDTTLATRNSLVMIDATHFILAYAGTDDDGYIKTFSIDANYDNITQIDVLEHDTAIGRDNSFVMLDATHFILAYQGSVSGNLRGVLKIFSIDANFDNIAQTYSLNHDTNNSTGGYNSLVIIDATHFILAYTGLDSDGYIKTFSIAENYSSITQIAVLEHDTVFSFFSSLVKIDASHFLLAYQGTASAAKGVLKIFSINASYQAITQVRSSVFDTSGLDLHISLCRVTAFHYVLAYIGANSDGYVRTIVID